MTELILTKSAVIIGSSCCVWGLTKRWWLAAVAGCLGVLFQNYATIGMALVLMAYVVWSSVRRPRKPKPPGDIIDAEYEVIS